MAQTSTEWTDKWPDTPAAKDFDQVGPASGNRHLSDAPSKADTDAAQAAFGPGAAGTSPADNGWDIGKD
jgi:hypothetical protein